MAVRKHDDASAPARTANDIAVASRNPISIDQAVADLQRRLEINRKETERFSNERILKYDKLEELVAALAKRIARSKADERASFGVSEVQNFAQAIEILRPAKASDVHIQPLLEAQACECSDSGSEPEEGKAEGYIQKRRRNAGASEDIADDVYGI